MTDAARKTIEDRVVKDESGCWIWQRSLTATGYGQLTFKRKHWLAHRFAHDAFKGEVPYGAYVQHSCDRPRCVNPDHLSIGTAATNNRDKQTKGRAALVLTADAVSLIRASNENARAVAAKFGVSTSMIHKVRTRENWDHIPGGGENRNPRKMNLAGACIARHMQRRGARVADIAHAFGMSRGYMQHVLAGRRWSDWSQLSLTPTEED